MFLLNRIIPCCLALTLFITVPANAEKKFRVGLALPLSGPAADYGAAYKRGIELAAADLPEAADKIEIVFEDHRYDLKTVVSAARKLATADKVHLLSVWGYAPSDAVAPLDKELKIPLLLNTVNAVGRDRPDIFNLSTPSRNKLLLLANFLNKQKISRLTIVGSQIGTLDQWIQELKDLLPSDIVVVGTHSILPNEMDLSTLVSRVKSENPDVVTLLLLADQARSFILKARELKFNPSIIGTDTLNDELVIKLFDNNNDGPIFVDAYSDDHFLSRLKNMRIPLSHTTEVASGYLFFTLIAHLADTVEIPLSREAILSALQRFPAGYGPIGNYEVKYTKEFGWYIDTKAALYRVANGKINQFNLSPSISLKDIS